MKKRLITLLIPLLLLSVAILPQTAQAKPLARAIPLTLATAQDVFNGTTYGAMNVMNISDPAVVNAGDYYHKRILLTDNDPSGPRMEIGFQKVLPGKTDPICQKTWSSPYLSYYWILEDAENVQFKDCYPINSAEINTDTRFREYTDSNGNGVFNWFNASDNYNKTVTVTNQIGQLIDPEYSTITYAETYNGTVSGHTIWGTTITQNNWMDGNHNWNYQTDASGNHLSGCIGNGCPTTGGIEWYWEDGKYPHDTGSAGGTMDNCLYASYGPYPYCTIGG